MERFQTFRKRLHVDYPECHLFVLSIKPSPKRWNIWPDAVAANELLRQECEADPLLTYVDVASPMFTSDGELRPELFIEDRLHMNREGYKIWRKVLRAALLPDTVD
jgi:lysophospholipase L1-like esterase